MTCLICPSTSPVFCTRVCSLPVLHENLLPADHSDKQKCYCQTVNPIWNCCAVKIVPICLFIYNYTGPNIQVYIYI